MVDNDLGQEGSLPYCYCGGLYVGFEVISCPLTSVCLLVKLVECGEWCGVSSHFSISVICFLFYHLQNTSSSFQESKNTLKCVQFYPDENFNSIVSPEYFIMQ